jgi:hypothetical protein
MDFEKMKTLHGFSRSGGGMPNHDFGSDLFGRIRMPTAAIATKVSGKQ